MLRDPKAWRNFENERIRREPVDLQRNIYIYEEMAKEAKSLGVFPPKNPLEGLEHKIRLTGVLNALPRRS